MVLSTLNVLGDSRRRFLRIAFAVLLRVGALTCKNASEIELVLVLEVEGEGEGGEEEKEEEGEELESSGLLTLSTCDIILNTAQRVAVS